MRTRTWHVIVPTAAVLAFGAVGCGTDDPAQDSDPTTSEMMSEDMTEDMTEDMSEDMTEDMSESMTEDMTESEG